MIKSIWNFLVKNSTIIMLVGRLIILVCFVMLVINMLNKNSTTSIPWEIIIGGVVFYIVGFIAKQAKQKTPPQEDNSDEL